MGDQARDVTNHVLFEVATEVANRGMYSFSPTAAITPNEALKANLFALAAIAR